jgi:hypothetical protein
MRKMAVYLGLVEDHGDEAYDEHEDYENARRGTRDSRAQNRGYDERCVPSAAMQQRRVARRRLRSPIGGRP